MRKPVMMIAGVAAAAMVAPAAAQARGGSYFE